jgi:hypothetical protein
VKKFLSILTISTILFVANLSFAQNSDDTILVQLNNLQIKEIQQNPEEDILATFIVTKVSLGFKCQYFSDEESEKPKPCPLKLRRNILKALRQGLKVNISEETELLDINRENINIQDFKVGDKINVYGELDRRSYEIDALIVRRIGKGKIVPPPVTGVIKVISPNGGEVWQKGNTYEIVWEQKVGGTFEIHLERKKSHPYECSSNFCHFSSWAPLEHVDYIGSGLGNAGKNVFRWTIFRWIINSQIQPGNDYAVCVQVEYKGFNYDCSDAPFRIVEKEMTPTDWETYKNEKYGFEFKYSKELVKKLNLDIKDEGDGFVRFIDKKNGFVKIAVGKGTDEGGPFARFSLMSDPTAGKTTLGGLPALKKTLIDTEGGEFPIEYERIFVYQPDKDVGVNIRIINKDETYRTDVGDVITIKRDDPDYMTLFHQIITTFKFIQ